MEEIFIQRLYLEKSEKLEKIFVESVSPQRPLTKPKRNLGKSQQLSRYGPKEKGAINFETEDSIYIYIYIYKGMYIIMGRFFSLR